jgi:DNA-binding NtrC family response regulator
MRVLTIDDSSRFRSTVRQLFTAFGHTVAEAATVTSIHAPLGKNIFDLVVAPTHDDARNVAMIMAVRMQSPIPLMFIGRRDAPRIPDEFVSVAESISAPFSIDDLSDRIASLMAKHRELPPGSHAAAR